MLVADDAVALTDLDDATARVASGDPTRSPGLVTRRNDGVFVVTGPGAPRLLTRPASAVVVRTAPTRAGFTP